MTDAGTTAQEFSFQCMADPAYRRRPKFEAQVRYPKMYGLDESGRHRGSYREVLCDEGQASRWLYSLQRSLSQDSGGVAKCRHPRVPPRRIPGGIPLAHERMQGRLNPIKINVSAYQVAGTRFQLLTSCCFHPARFREPKHWVHKSQRPLTACADRGIGSDGVSEASSGKLA